MNHFNPVTTALWLSFLAYWVVSALFAKRSVGRRGAWRGIAFRAALILAVAFASLSSAVGDVMLGVERAFGLGSNPFVVGTGIALCALGLALAAWARAHLGRNWGVPMSLRRDHDLVTTGPYAFSRHPIYGGILIALLGTGMAEGPLSLELFVVFFVYFTYCATVEERDLDAQFCGEYRSYRLRTKMLVPFIV
jgi:protein-S-isoprenylcysteine O-methyltransferase Ste14